MFTVFSRLPRLLFCLLAFSWFISWFNCGQIARAGDAPASGAADSQVELQKAEDRLIKVINDRIAERWARDQVVPAWDANDAEFLRRVYLDLAGQIPPVSAVRRFLADKAPAKRRKVVRELLESPRYIVHFSNVWRAELLPEVSADPQLQFLMPSFEAWLKDQLIDNDSYAELVRQLVTFKITGVASREASEAGGVVSPVAFYQAKEGKPENLAAGTARVFLGLRIECAQCHDHPFDSWKQDQFWSFAAFFSGVSRQQMGDVAGPLSDAPQRRMLEIPGKKMAVPARYLNGAEPVWIADQATRENLAAWLTATDNPYFAKAAVNRVWGRLFGVGIVDPVDDFSEANPASHPELLDELAVAFAASGYDLKFLLRVLTATRAYQLTSSQSDPSQEPPQRFARMALKGLTPEQLFDSVGEATGLFERSRRRTVIIDDESRPRNEFQEAFSNDTDPPTERPTTILQALAMMNGQLLTQATNPESGTLAAAIHFPDMTNEERIETLYLASLGRLPRPDELKKMTAHCHDRNLSEALSNIFWALLNSSEFILNH